MRLSFKQLFYILAFVFGIFAILIFAKSILIPFSMALFISFILFPVVKKLESWGVNRFISAFLSMFVAFIIIGGGITLFSAEIMSLSSKLTDFSGKLLKASTEVLVVINENVNFIDDLSREDVIEKGKEWIEESSASLVQNTFSNTASFLTGIVVTIVFTFLILIYRDGLTKAFVAFGDDENKVKISRMLKNIQRVGKKYLSGMFLLIIILGVANSVGLWIIGVDSPFLFGFLAALMSIVPFIGTIIGASIPILYSFISADSLWVPFAVIILFWIIQTVESNFLNPKIVGSSLNVNPLVAILSLLIGASVWGIAGMVLFLPFAAILKVVCEEFDQLKPIAMIISNDIGDNNKETKTSKWFKKIKGWFKNTSTESKSV